MRSRAALALAATLFLTASGSPEAAAPEAPPLPAQPSRWVGDPVSWEDLRGRVTLVFVWTFG